MSCDEGIEGQVFKMVCVFIPENSAAAFSEKLNFAIAMQNTLEHFSPWDFKTDVQSSNPAEI